MFEPQAMFQFSAQVLSFSLPGQGSPDFAPLAPDAKCLARASRTLRALRDNGRENILLLGLGRGALVNEIARILPAGCGLCLCEPEPARLRQALAQNALPWWGPTAPVQALCDSSLWALALYALLQGLGPRNCLCMLNPEEKEPERLRGLKLLRELLSLPEPLDLEQIAADSSAQDMTFAAILRPDEPDLGEFCRCLPQCAAEAVLLWDAPEVPEIAARLPYPEGARVRHFARPLAGDFAAQRNFLLAQCRGQWVYYLDADERPSPGLIQALPWLMAQNFCTGIYFPRLTLYPDPAHAKLGAGLWPDLQLRLFKPDSRTRFERPVHERLSGLQGRAGLALQAPILHLSNLTKNPQELQQKHAGFDAASGQRLTHCQSLEYPSLDLKYLNPPGANRLLVLPARMGWPA